MAEQPGGERTEKPSAKRLKDAHEKGQVARSQDFVAALILLAVTVVLVRTGTGALARMSSRLASGLSRLDESARHGMALNDLANLVVADIVLLGTVAGPFLMAAATVALAANFSQTGWVFAPDRLTPDWSKLSPSKGLSRLKPSQSGLDLLKTMVKATAVGVLGYYGIREVMYDGPRLAWLSAPAAAAAGWEHLRSLLTQAGIALLAIAGADYGLQKWRHHSSLKMTKQELRDEAKMSEGSPEVKARVRRIQREMTRKRMLGAVKTATVVITNPTHYAVALRYDRATMTAPVVVAKGADHMAQRIKKLARDAGVPMVENVPLAQALYKGAEVGGEIPGPLFGAVAEVLAYLVRIKQLML